MVDPLRANKPTGLLADRPHALWQCFNYRHRKCRRGVRRPHGTAGTLPQL